MRTRKVLNKGFVTFVGSVGSDLEIIKAAGGFDLNTNFQQKLFMKMLLDKKNETPFETVVFEFNIKCPLFLTRLWTSHKQSSIIGRYEELDEFYVPSYFKTDGGTFSEQECNELYTKIDNYNTWTQNFYKKLLTKGMKKEQARMILPQNIYTQFYWRTDARGLMNFLKHQLSDRASYEMQQYAKVLLDFLKENLPITGELFENGL